MNRTLTPGPSPDDGGFAVGRGEQASPKGTTSRVECYSGWEYAETPRAVWRENQRLEVAEVEARWRFPGGQGFRVETAEGLVFNLTYTEADDVWQIQQA